MKRRRHAASDSRDRGSVAVEFALLLPVLLLLIFGIIDFGRAINAQITLTQAAREGARLASLGYSTSAVTTRAQSAATGLSPVTVTVTSSCPAGAGAAAARRARRGRRAGRAADRRRAAGPGCPGDRRGPALSGAGRAAKRRRRGGARGGEELRHRQHLHAEPGRRVRQRERLGAHRP